MQKAKLRKFLNDAVIDPNDKKDRLLHAIVEEGTSHQFELKAMEYIEEAARLRQRYNAKNDSTLLELYCEKLRLAATFVALAAEKLTDEERTTRVQSKGT